jgi:hypothetical protein
MMVDFGAKQTLFGAGARFLPETHAQDEEKIDDDGSQADLGYCEVLSLAGRET